MAKSTKQNPALDLAADKAAALALTPVSREIEARLDRYVALLLEWQATTNLVAPSTLPNLWTRHISDSLQLLTLAPKARTWVDFGSGGGFPGVVLACAMQDAGGVVHMVERNGKKAAFLREAVRVAGGSAQVHARTIEELDIENVGDSVPGAVDCVTARALAPLHLLLGFAEPFVKQGAQALFLKGQDVESELTEATKYWNIEPKLHHSQTGDGWVVEINEIVRRSNAAASRAHQ